MASTKFYIYRISNISGRKEYKRTKCLDYWSLDKSVCWKFSRQGAKNIVASETGYDRFGRYSYGMESV